jgi:two-component system phosphate regulon sensor histidine kinase PhoR
MDTWVSKNGLSRTETLLITGLIAGALLTGWLTGAYGWAFFGFACVWMAIQHRERLRLIRWSKRSLQRPLNDLEPWRSIAYDLYYALRRTRRRHTRSLESFKTLKSITDALPDAAIVLDTRGFIEDVNIAAERLLRLTREDQGSHLSARIRAPEIINLLNNPVHGETIELASPFDDTIRLEARFILLETRHDGSRAMLLVRDVTELNRLLSMRQDFIANVSHELRTPLTVMVGYVEALLDTQLDPATISTLVSKLKSPSDRMQALVDDLLLLTRLEASPGPAEDELVDVDMVAIANAVAADGKILSAGGHTFEVVADHGVKVRGIPRELHSACLNLVTNAVRYSPDGGAITIRWGKVAEGARFSVEDQGMGIPKEQLSRLTERFYRVDLTQARVRGGTGLGLAIVKHILKRHNTHLQVESALARGSRFFWVFPEAQLT